MKLERNLIKIHAEESLILLINYFGDFQNGVSAGVGVLRGVTSNLEPPWKKFSTFSTEILFSLFPCWKIRKITVKEGKKYAATKFWNHLRKKVFFFIGTRRTTALERKREIYGRAPVSRVSFSLLFFLRPILFLRFVYFLFVLFIAIISPRRNIEWRKASSVFLPPSPSLYLSLFFIWLSRCWILNLAKSRDLEGEERGGEERDRNKEREKERMERRER